MSVLIKGMEMPKTCWGCQFGDDCGETVHCNITGESQIADKRHDCPLVEIPTPHGRLIDADALNLEYEVEMADDWKTAHEIANCVKYASTIIEAEE